MRLMHGMLAMSGVMMNDLEELDLQDCTTIYIALLIYRQFFRNKGVLGDYTLLLLNYNYDESRLNKIHEILQSIENKLWRIINASRRS